MSFWDKVKGFGKDIGRAWTDWYDESAKPNLGLAYDMAVAATSGDTKEMKKTADDWAKVNEERGLVRSALGPLDPLAQNVATTVGAGAEFSLKAMDVPREWTSRAIATTGLVMGPGGVMNVGITSDQWFDANTWRRAWNASHTISPGQVMVASIGAASRDNDGKLTMQEVLDYDEKVQGNSGQSGRQDDWYKWTTGALDFGFNFLDPSIGLGKVAKVGKLKYIDEMLTTKKAQDRYLDSNRMEKFLDSVEDADSATQVFQTSLSKSVRGAQQAHVLYSLRNDRDAMRLAMRGFLDDADAMEELIQRYPAAGEKITSAKTAETFDSLKSRADLAPEHPGALSMAERETLGAIETSRVDMSLKAYLEPDVLRDLKTTLVGQAAPKTGRVAEAKARMVQDNVYNRPIAVRVMKALNGDSRIIQRINVNDNFGGATDLRRYLERSRLDGGLMTGFLDRYMAAPSAATRAIVVNEAENAAIKATAAHHGLPDHDIQQIMNVAGRGRAAARWEAQQKTKKFGSEETVRGVEDIHNEGVTHIDSDGLVTLEGKPLLESQTADIVHLGDLEHLERVLTRHSSKLEGTRHLAGGAMDRFKDFSDDVTAIWKVGVLLRGGWTVRALSDEVGRAAAYFGVVDTAFYGMRGTFNAGRNLIGRGRAGITAARARDPAEETAMLEAIGKPTVRGSQALIKNVTMAKGGETIEIGKQRLRGERKRYNSLEEAYVNGELLSEHYIEALRGLADAGTLKTAERDMLNAFDSGQISQSKFQNELFDHVLGKFEANHYVDGAWQGRVINDALTHGKVEVSPFTGDIGRAAKRTNEALLDERIITRRPDGNFDPDDVYDFIATNRDKLTWRGSRMTAEVDKSGGLRLIVHAPKSAAAVRKSTKVRHAMFRDFAKGKRSQASEGYRVPSSFGGEDYDVKAVLEDELVGKNASTDGYGGGGMANMITGAQNTAVGRITANPSYSDVRHTDDPVAFKIGWERATNHQLASDSVARRILNNETDDEIVDFLESKAARSVRRDLPHLAQNPKAWVSGVRFMVDQHVPDVSWVDGNGIERHLREEVLNQRAKVEDYMEAVKQTGEEIPPVHGEAVDHALGKGSVWKKAHNGVNAVMRVLSTMPSDTASRFPFLDRSYKEHVNMLVRNAEDLGERVSTAELERLQGLARENALKDVKTWLYNTESVSVLASKLRYFTAFTGATQDALSAWTRMTIRDPSTAVVLAKIWEAPDKAGLIVDQDGHQLRIIDGKEAWYQPQIDKDGKLIPADPNTPNIGKARSIILPIPGWATKKLYGIDVAPVPTIPKGSVNTILNINPGAHPLVAVATNEFLKRNPAVIMDDDKLAKWAVEQVLPFGVAAKSMEQVMPSTAKAVLDVWRGEESERFNSRMVGIWTTMMTDWEAGGRQGTRPSLDDAKERAGKIGALRLFGATMLPINPQWKSPYQPYIDKYHLMKQKSPMTADMDFYDEVGEEFFWLTNHVTKAMGGLPVSAKGFNFFEDHKDLMAKHPDLMGLIMGNEGAGEFNKSVYEAQKLMSLIPGGEKMRRPMNTEEIQADVEQRLGWIKYTKFMDAIQADLIERGLKTVNDEGAEDLSEAKQAFMTQNSKDNPAWGEDFYTVNPKAMERRIEGMVEIAKDERLRSRRDIQGLTSYLLLREQVRDELAERISMGGAKTLGAEDNADLASEWHAAVMDLVDKNPPFGNLYNRWLEHDKL